MERESTLNSRTEAGSPESLVSVRDVLKRYGSRKVLRIQRFDIPEGDRIQLLGANASGKSTLARLLAGYGAPTSGRVIRSGPARWPIGLLTQTGGVYRQLTLLQNLIVIARLHGRRSELNEYTEQAVTDLGLAPFLDRPVITLSGGLQRLSALAAVLCAHPAAIILDEPFAGLDAEKAERVREVIRKRTSAFHFVMVLGHNEDKTLGLDRVVRIESGAIASDAGGGAGA